MEKSISLITHIHDRSVFYFGTGTSIKCSNVKLVLCVQTSLLSEMMRSSGADPGGKIGKNMIFGRKIVIFHTKYPKNVPASLRSAQFFKMRPP
jgi:predicted metalloenzyme YecM